MTMEVAFYCYLGCFLFGLLFALISAVFGGLFDTDFGDGGVDIGDMDANVDVTSDAVSLSPLSPMVICVFLAVFGGTGIICIELFETSILVSLAASTLMGLLVATVFFTGMSWLMNKAQGSMGLSATSILGGEAEVTLAIPRNGLGEISFVANEMRQRASAKSEDGKPIPQSQVVTVVRYTGNFYIVRPTK
ncbi:hypothetical protein JXA47_01000 [Candidatus Sumerlaeota bacterium]|nr:hypothetical protein [Candidatus Sumerlaeota bacterium]